MPSRRSACSCISSWAIALSGACCSGRGRASPAKGCSRGWRARPPSPAWFLLYDLAAGVPFRTPALLGAALFHGLRDPGALVITWTGVVQYTVLHVLAFAIFGWLAAGLLALADREPRLLFGFLMLFCCFEVFFFAMVAALAEWLFDSLAWWTILAGNLLAALVMLAVFFRGHRVAWREFLAASR